jgi:hypothetical protein
MHLDPSSSIGFHLKSIILIKDNTYTLHQSINPLTSINQTIVINDNMIQHIQENYFGICCTGYVIKWYQSNCFIVLMPSMLHDYSLSLVCDYIEREVYLYYFIKKFKAHINMCLKHLKFLFQRDFPKSIVVSI